MKISDAPTLKKTDKQLMKILAWGGAVKHIVKELAQVTQIIFIPECCLKVPMSGGTPRGMKHAHTQYMCPA